MAFDPYHKWLGIPSAEQPPNHYRLLAIALFENDPDVIETAADQRMALLRTFQSGQHSALSQKLLNELSAARLCLLTPEKKSAYDAELRRGLAAVSRPAPDIPQARPLPAERLPPLSPPAAEAEAPVLIVADRQPLRHTSSKRRTGMGRAASAWLALAAVAVPAIAFLVYLISTKTEQPKEIAKAPGDTERRNRPELRPLPARPDLPSNPEGKGEANGGVSRPERTPNRSPAESGESDRSVFEFRTIETEQMQPIAANGAPVGDAEERFIPLFNGKDLAGWKTHPSQPGNWRIANGVLIGAESPASHIYSERGNYTNFHLRAEARINDGGNGGLYARSSFGPASPAKWPSGYEAQINSTGNDNAKTGSLYKAGSVVYTVATPPVRPNEWFTLELIAGDNHILVKVNGEKMADYHDDSRSFPMGHIALQQHDPHTVVEFRKIEIRELNGADESGAITVAASPLQKPGGLASETGLPRGRYVRIELPRTGTISLAEVEIFSGGRNIARSAKATQKNTGWGGHASRGTDGNTSGIYNNGGATHTENDTPEPWWEVDLGDNHPLESIVVYNRTDGDLEKWLNGFTLLVLDAGRRVVAKRMGIPAPEPSTRFEVADLTADAKSAPAAKLTATEAFSLRQHTAAVTRIAFNRMMPVLASADKHGQVLLWNLQRPGDPPLTMHKFGEEVWAIKFSPDGTNLALANRKFWGSTLLFKTLSGHQLNEVKDFKGGASAIASLAYSPDGHFFAAGLDNGTIRLWDIAQLRELSAVGLGERHNVYSLAFGPVTRDRKRQPTGYLLAAGGEDGEVRTLAAALTKTKNDSQWTFQPTTTKFPKSAPVLGIRFSLDGNLLGVSRADGSVSLYDPRNGGQPVSVLIQGRGRVEGIAFHPQKPWCLTAHKDEQAARIWNIETAELLAELKGHAGGVMCADFSPDGRQVATASEDFSIKVWDLAGADLPTPKKGKKTKPAALTVGD